MGYKILGYAVWRGGKWYLRRRMSAPKAKLAVAGLGAVVLAGVAVASRQATNDS